jgi:L-serine dehydratase
LQLSNSTDRKIPAYLYIERRPRYSNPYDHSQTDCKNLIYTKITMNISIFDLFNIGIGPSSSHTIGPMRAAKEFIKSLHTQDILQNTYYINIDLYGSLAFTGKGHGTDMAIMMGLGYHDPETIEPSEIPNKLGQIITSGIIKSINNHPLHFIQNKNIILHFDTTLPGHSNGMQFTAYDQNDTALFEDIYYSTGGGFIVNANTLQLNAATAPDQQLPFPFETAQELLAHCKTEHKTIAEIVKANELHWRTDEQINSQALKIWHTMDQAIGRGCNTGGTLAGGLNVPRRAASIFQKLRGTPVSTTWLNAYAMAVNEENASGGRVVTAPTNGASGIIPAVIKYYQEFYQDYADSSIIEFILTAGAIGILFKKGASISGAEMGCMGEVGVACSMAAAALTAVLGGNIQQVEQAAEIAIEHHFGLTCDPVKGLVQIPCIERNAMGAIKAVNASTISLLEEGKHIVSLDNAIKTMRETGRDMSTHYKETSLGGLAVNVPEC